MKFHLNEGRNGDNTQVVDADLLAESHAPQNVIATSSSTDKYFTKPVMPVTLSTTSYGLGWRIGHYRG